MRPSNATTTEHLSTPAKGAAIGLPQDGNPSGPGKPAPTERRGLRLYDPTT
jgi:hypothetical protein